jgi:hypothetical protein
MSLFDDIFNTSGPYRQQLVGVGGAAQQNANQAQGFANQNANYTQQDQGALNSQRNYLQGQMMGQNSVSAEQLKQGLQQNLASQQAMAASANPNNAAMAARNAAMNMGQANAGLSGQQAIAGLQERNQAAQQLSNLNLGALGTNTQAALGGWGAANQGLGVASGAYGAAMGNPGTTPGNTIANAALGFGGAALMSDEDTKQDVGPGNSIAGRVMSGLASGLGSMGTPGAAATPLGSFSTALGAYVGKKLRGSGPTVQQTLGKMGTPLQQSSSTSVSPTQDASAAESYTLDPSVLSDKRAKKDINGGGDASSKVMAGLKAKTYSYKDPRNGAGKQLGVMAQDLEHAGLKQAVVDTPAGKVLHVGKLTGANTAMIAALHDRVSKLEKAGKAKSKASAAAANDNDGDES